MPKARHVGVAGDGGLGRVGCVAGHWRSEGDYGYDTISEKMKKTMGSGQINKKRIEWQCSVTKEKGEIFLCL